MRSGSSVDRGVVLRTDGCDSRARRPDRSSGPTEGRERDAEREVPIEGAVGRDLAWIGAEVVQAFDLAIAVVQGDHLRELAVVARTRAMAAPIDVLDPDGMELFERTRMSVLGRGDADRTERRREDAEGRYSPRDLLSRAGSSGALHEKGNV